MTSPPVLNRDLLFRHIPEDALDELLPCFLEEAVELVGSLHPAWARGDMEAVRRGAHALKGTAGNLGAEDLHGRASAIEDAIKAGRVGSLEGEILALSASLEALEKSLAELLAG
jgi:HPt (histidine-containing phosphotransfer) domain-containing protein